MPDQPEQKDVKIDDLPESEQELDAAQAESVEGGLLPASEIRDPLAPRGLICFVVKPVGEQVVKPGG